LLTIFANAQLEKGDRYFGGFLNLTENKSASVNGISNKSNSNKTQFSFSPSIGYFIRPNMVVGGLLSINFSKNYSENLYENQGTGWSLNTYTQRARTFGIGGFVRRYYNINQRLKFFVTGSLQGARTRYLNKTTTYDTTTVESSSKAHSYGMSMSIAPGISYFFNRRMELTTTFGNLNYSYNHSKTEDLAYDNHTNSSTLSINMSLSSFYFGLNYYF
jgi:hypothetical protein